MTVLQTNMAANYSLARSYYTAKRKQLEKLYESKMLSSLSDLEVYISQAVEEYHNKIIKQVYDHIDIKQGKVVNVTLPDVSTSVDVISILEKIAASVANGKMITRQNVGALLGNTFETFITEALSTDEFIEAASGVAGELADRVVNTLASGLNVTHTGQIKAKSAVTAGIKNIRPDIGLGFSESQIQGAGVELENWLDIEDLTLSAQDALQSKNILKTFLESEAFGLSLKIWNADNSNTKKFSDSSTLQAKINEELITINKHGNRTTWESFYTMDYVNYQVSKYLINIISPLNVAVVSGSGLIWMDDFLANRMFYMQVQIHFKDGTSTRGAGYEGFPEIISPGIFIRQVAKDNIQSLFDYNVGVMRKTGKIFMRNRKIISSI